MTQEKKESLLESWRRLKRNLSGYLKTNWTIISCTFLIIWNTGSKGVSLVSTKASNFMDTVECTRILAHSTDVKLAAHMEDVRSNKQLKAAHEKEQDDKIDKCWMNIQRLLVKNNMSSEEAVNDTMNPSDRSNTRIAYIK